MRRCNRADAPIDVRIPVWQGAVPYWPPPRGIAAELSVRSAWWTVATCGLSELNRFVDCRNWAMPRLQLGVSARDGRHSAKTEPSKPSASPWPRMRGRPRERRLPDANTPCGTSVAGNARCPRTGQSTSSAIAPGMVRWWRVRMRSCRHGAQSKSLIHMMRNVRMTPSCSVIETYLPGTKW